MSYSNEIDNTTFTRRHINNVILLGAINQNSIISGVSGEGRESFIINKPPIEAPAIVLSHSYELDKKNGIKLTSIILAPLRDISTATEEKKIQEIIDSNTIKEGTQLSYLKYYYLPHHESLGLYPRGSIVDFSKRFSYKKDSYDYLLSHKILQLTKRLQKRCH